MKMKVICLYGEPSAGKTALMLSLTSRLKRLGVNADIAGEYYKEKVYENTPVGEEDNLAEITKRTHSLVDKTGGQLGIFAEQYKRLKRLEGTVDFAVTDCPLPLIGYYSRNDDDPHLFGSIKHRHSTFDNIGFLLKRTHEFESRARVHSEDEAMQVSKELPGFLSNFTDGKEKITIVKSCDDLDDIVLMHLIKDKHLMLPVPTLEKFEARTAKLGLMKPF